MLFALAPAFAAALVLVADAAAPDAGTAAQKPAAAAASDVPVPLTKPTITGALSKDEITKVLKRHQNEVRSCYDQALRIKPTLEGKVVVKFIIDGKGDVALAEIASDTLNDENLKACMMNVVRSWKFPEPKGGGNVTVTYPWSFKPGA